MVFYWNFGSFDVRYSVATSVNDAWRAGSGFPGISVLISKFSGHSSVLTYSVQLFGEACYEVHYQLLGLLDLQYS